MGTGGLFGRATELGAINRALDGLAAGDPSGVMQIVGEPGIGKSRLVAELRDLASARGFGVYVGRSTEYERDVPFGIVVDALDDELRHADLDDRWVPELANIFPALAGRLHQSPSVLQAERYRSYRAVRALLDDWASSHPLLIAFDDVQWSDPASLELLSFLVAHPPDAPTLIVLAYRSAELSEGLRRISDTAARDYPELRLDLAPLAPEDAGALLQDVGEVLRDRLYRQSGGNPFYLEQLARAASATTGSEHPSSIDAEEDVPAAVRLSLANELSGLSDAAQMLLNAASVVGDPFELTLAAAAAGIDDDEALDVVDEILRQDLVRETRVTRRFRFRHPIVRRAVYEATPQSSRVKAHAVVARRLESEGASAVEVAHHIEQSASVGDLDSAETLTAAGHEVVARAPANAAHWYEAALGLLPRTSEMDGRRVELLIARATALGAAGRLEESRDALAELLTLLPSDAPGRAGIVAFAAGVENFLGSHRRARELLQRELEEVGDQHSPDTATLTAALAATAPYTNDWDEMRASGVDTLDIALDLRDRPLECHARCVVAYADLCLGLIPEAREHLDVAIQIFDGLDDSALGARLDLAFWTGWTQAQMEQFEGALRHYERAIDLSRRTGQGQFLIGIMAAQAYALLFAGRVPEAIEVARAAEDASRISTHGFLSEVVGVHSWAVSAAGDRPAAVRLGRESLDLARSLDIGLMTAVASYFLCGALIEAGDFERARSELLGAGGGPSLAQLKIPGPRAISYDMLTRADIALGRLDEAADWVKRAQEIAPVDRSLPMVTMIAERAHARLLVASGSAREGAELAQSAAERGEGVAPLEAARTRIFAGQAFARAGDRKQAVVELEAAYEQLKPTGAIGLMEDAAAELRRLGQRRHRPRGGATDGLASLSEREREIALLVTSGRTNREIAAACFLSEKTVERHLTHIFQKLGVSGRAAVAAAVAGRLEEPSAIVAPS